MNRLPIFRRPVRVLGVVVAGALLAVSGVTVTAHAGEGTSAATAALGPVVDPDQQIADFRASVRADGWWAGAPDPGQKAKSPITTLDTMPKFTAGQLASMSERDRAAQAAQPSGETEHADVVTVETTAEGTGVALYTPVPGVTPEELAADLRKQGYEDVRIIRGQQVQPMAPGDCAYGRARSITCPVSFWTNNGYEDPIVRFNDHSSDLWPATNAVYKWNQVPNIDSWYLWNSCPFMAGARCVDVLSANYGATTWVGRTWRFYPTSTHHGAFREQGHYVQLNDYHAPVGFTRNNVVTHELGHVLGLGHNTWSGDVLYEIANTREDIGGENPVLLASIYSITR
jgi:hypothetical protein